MNIVLIGYRGTGKSTVAKILGQRQGRTVISTDAEIVNEAGQSIPEIVEQFGWDHFRELETQICRKLKDHTDLVIDTGGGLILKEENVKILKANGTLFLAHRGSADHCLPDRWRYSTSVPFWNEDLRRRNRRYPERTNSQIPGRRQPYCFH